ncbi:cytochrome-c peroxidase [Chitinophagaceae bacterium MMS25-I14]
MKKAAFILTAIILIAAYVSCKQEKETPEKKIAGILLEQIDDFIAAKNKLQQAAANDASQKELQQLFKTARLRYKKFEWAAEYFVPAATRFINGAPVPEVEMSGTVFDPQGLQVIESLLYPTYDKNKKQELLQRIQSLQGGCDNYISYFKNIDILDWQVFDAAKLQVFRVLTLGITGFDTPLLQNSLEESAVSIDGMKDVLACYMNGSDPENIDREITAASGYLSTHPDFNSFDRAAFITQYGNPLSADISDMEKRLNIKVMRYNRLLNQDARTLFDKNAFNLNAYTPDISCTVNDKKTELGKKLFADPILSGDRSRSCQSCHQPAKAFTDGLAKNTILHSQTLLKRNTPTLLNAALQPAQFYDTRAIMLEDQARAVIENKDEMHGSMEHAIHTLWEDKIYRRLFSETFPQKERTGISEIEVLNAIGSYIRSLTALNSRFDEYMTGNKSVMTPDELHGFNLFMGKAKCGTCHYMPLFNGTFPPRYMRIETEVIGVPQVAGGTAIDSDMGRYNIIHKDFFRHAFKTSTVRNAARTAPYMHNGVYKTLDEVVDFYNKGGGKGLGMDIDNQTLPFDKLNLSKKECDDIVAFIKTLDSK